MYKSLDQSEDFTIIYLDISRYFEKIWHSGLLAKCKLEFGIQGPLLCWLSSYLTGRSQVVQVGNKRSPPLVLQAGVPQGSVLVPSASHYVLERTLWHHIESHALLCWWQFPTLQSHTRQCSHQRAGAAERPQCHLWLWSQVGHYI